MLEAEDASYLHFEFQTTYSKEDLARFMVSDAMLHFKEGKPIRTIVVYSADIEETVATLDAGSIQYKVEPFYMAKLNGDEAYEKLKTKVTAGEPLTKQDLMSIVFLPLMKNGVDKVTRFGQAFSLVKELEPADEQLQIQAMLELLADKFITDGKQLKKLKEMINVGALLEMLKEDAKLKAREEVLTEVREEIITEVRDEILTEVSDEVVGMRNVEIARNMLKDGEPCEKIMRYTGLTREEVESLVA
ncbi:MAG: hypothetical protein LBR83_01325 [Clostridiales bacterium]|nr:hypothetical protein [Clostridiales bacterium]